MRLIFESLGESLQLQYMDIKDPAELWRRIQSDYIGERQKSQLWIRRDLYEVKLKDYGSIEAYAMRIHNLIDEYRAGAESSNDKISERGHVFFLLNGIPQSEDWDVELQLIKDQMRVLGEDPKAVIKKLRNREVAFKTSRGIVSEVALIGRPVIWRPLAVRIRRPSRRIRRAAIKKRLAPVSCARRPATLSGVSDSHEWPSRE
jgi:hypothetical protein